MPRKGTETIARPVTRTGTNRFGNEMPRKGTETFSFSYVVYYLVSFGNEMPRKGTETMPGPVICAIYVYLEMRCPGRGRKHNQSLCPLNYILLIWK